MTFKLREKMADKKRQHYVPRFYLKNFSINSEGKAIGIYERKTVPSKKILYPYTYTYTGMRTDGAQSKNLASREPGYRESFIFYLLSLLLLFSLFGKW